MANLFDQETITARVESADTVVGTIYRIVSQATLDFTTVGSPDNTAGTVFIATSIDTLGSGDALSEITAPNKGIPDVDPWPALAGPLENSGTSTDDTFYRIMLQDGVDFTGIGAPDNNVGTYFYSDGTIGLDANDALRPVQLSWVPYGTNTIEIDETEDALYVAQSDNSSGASLQLNNDSDLSSDLVIGQKYSVNFEAKPGTDQSVVVQVNYVSGLVTTGNIANGFNYYNLIFTESTSGAQINFQSMGAGDEVWIRNLSIVHLPNLPLSSTVKGCEQTQSDILRRG